MKTNKMKKVLIALDYNPTAQKVAEIGFSMAKAMNAEVTLLHVISEMVYYSSTEYDPIMGFTGFREVGSIELNNLDTLKNASFNYLDKTRQHLGDSTAHTLVEEGDIAESILKAAKAIQADLIVIGSHSQKWLKNILMGSVTEKVLSLTTLPLFIIPTKKHE
jgi:nucleotide-binding universal stress UspA family protein